LDAFIGSPDHPDEAALRRAAQRFVIAVLENDAAPDPVETLRAFAASVIQEAAIVALTASLTDRALTRDEAAREEREVKDWIAARLANTDLGLQGGNLDLARFGEATQRLTEDALEIMAAVKA
jgi:hypothetical protein